MMLMLSFFVLVLLLNCIPIPPVDPYNAYVRGGHFECRCVPSSNEGGACLFSTPASGRGDIILASLSEQQFVPVVSSTLTEYAPVVSADGGMMAFTRRGISGAIETWVVNRKNAQESKITESRLNEYPIDISNSGEWIILKREQATGGLERRSLSILVPASEKKPKVELGIAPAFFLSESEVVTTHRGDNQDPATDTVVIYDIQKRSFSKICRGTLLLPLSAHGSLVVVYHDQNMVVDLSGDIIRKLDKLNGSFQVAVSKEWVAAVDRKRRSIRAQRCVGPDISVELPALSEAWEITQLSGSDFGFLVIARKHEYDAHDEWVVTASPPFESWEWRFSAQNMRWH